MKQSIHDVLESQTPSDTHGPHGGDVRRETARLEEQAVGGPERVAGRWVDLGVIPDRPPPFEQPRRKGRWGKQVQHRNAAKYTTRGRQGDGGRTGEAAHEVEEMRSAVGRFVAAVVGVRAVVVMVLTERVVRGRVLVVARMLAGEHGEAHTLAAVTAAKQERHLDHGPGDDGNDVGSTAHASAGSSTPCEPRQQDQVAAARRVRRPARQPHPAPSRAPGALGPDQRAHAPEHRRRWQP